MVPYSCYALEAGGVAAAVLVFLRSRLGWLLTLWSRSAPCRPGRGVCQVRHPCCAYRVTVDLDGLLPVPERERRLGEWERTLDERELDLSGAPDPRAVSEVAAERDRLADGRDGLADVRDGNADRSDDRAEQREAASSRQDARAAGLARELGEDDPAALQRFEAGVARDAAAGDRLSAREDRQAAGRNRTASRRDRSRAARDRKHAEAAQADGTAVVGTNGAGDR